MNKRSALGMCTPEPSHAAEGSLQIRTRLYAGRIPAEECSREYNDALEYCRRHYPVGPQQAKCVLGAGKRLRDCLIDQ
jgi:hypothetical protein